MTHEHERDLMLLGLTSHEAKVYGALVGIDRARVSDLTRLVNLPRQHIHTALRRLVDRGLALGHKNSVWSYSAVPPDVAFDRVLSEDRAALEAKAAAIKKLTEVYSRRSETTNPADVLEVIKAGRTAMDEQMRRLKSARHEVLHFYRFEGKGAEQEDFDALDEIELDQLRRGISVRCVYERAALANPANLRRFGRMVAYGEQARVVEKLPMNIQIVDDRTAIFILTRFQQGGTGFFINDPELVGMLRAGFEYYWQQGEDIAGYLSEDGGK